MTPAGPPPTIQQVVVSYVRTRLSNVVCAVFSTSCISESFNLLVGWGASHIRVSHEAAVRV
jgi:hypothetical protein